MERGLLAPLSPNEERTLRHVATGQWRLALLAERHIRRLAQLDLIHGVDGEVRLTEIGRKRYEQLPDKPVLRDSAPEQAMDAAPAKIADDPSALTVAAARRVGRKTVRTAIPAGPGRSRWFPPDW